MVSARATDRDHGALSGLKEICAYMRKSEPTIRRLIREGGFPAGKAGREWVSDVGSIARWRKGLARGRMRKGSLFGS